MKNLYILLFFSICVGSILAPKSVSAASYDYSRQNPGQIEPSHQRPAAMIPKALKPLNKRKFIPEIDDNHYGNISFGFSSVSIFLLGAALIGFFTTPAGFLFAGLEAFFVMALVSLVLGIVGFFFGILGLKAGKKKKMLWNKALAGTIISSTVLAFFGFIFIAIALFA